MSVPLTEALTRLPDDGGPGQAFSLPELGAYLRDPSGANLLADEEKERNARHARRDRLYMDGGHGDMRAHLFEMFDERIAKKLEKRIHVAAFSNALKRIVGELSTVYAKPARRYVSSGAAQAELDKIVSDLDLDAQLAHVNAMLNLHRALLVGPRVRVNPDGSRELVLDIATPSIVRAVPNPLDTTQILAWLIRVDMPLARNPYDRRPEWALWSDHECGYLDERLEPIAGTWKPHGLGLNRWVPLSYSANAIPRFWPGCEGEDLVAAQMTMWLCAILMIKETQATTRAPVINGDISTAARGQAADSDGPIHLPDGSSITSIELGTNPETFITAGDHALSRTGNSYGLAMDLMTHQGAQSAEARDILLAPVRERREKQIHIMRRFESRLWTVIARVLQRDMGETLDVSGFRMNFAEAQTLLSKKERLEVFEKERALGLTNTVDFLKSEDPDIDDDGAWDLMARNVMVETTRNVMMRPLQAVAGSMGAAQVAIDPSRQQPPNDGAQHNEGSPHVDPNAAAMAA